ncbi:hypothetical protein Sjap_003529 [Stephania japonica]|uniref:Uncharacterized protein n=1 Tax=Stephania japonica TaxID=461633 RepID=A0AAP0KQP0_9MAGN
MHQQATLNALLSSSMSAFSSNLSSKIERTDCPSDNTFLAAQVGKNHTLPSFACFKFLLPDMISNNIIP